MANNEQAPVEHHDSEHPSPAKYIQIAIILTIITALEVLIYYFDFSKEAFIAIFLGMSVVKFIIVAMYYMHLKFDHQLFTWLLIAGLILATTILLILGTLYRLFT